MNQKNIIAILGVVVVALIGTTVYFATINNANSPVAQTQPVAVTADSCHPTGCSNQICSDTDVVSTCEWRSEYACYKTATCARQSDGKCAWTQTPALKKCIETALKDTQTQQVANQQSATPPVDETASWQTYENKTYKFAFSYPKNFSIKESKRSFLDNMGAFCQLIALNDKTNFQVCDKANNLTKYGLREPDGMDPTSITDLTIGGQIAKKYSSDDYTSYVVMGPNSNRTTLDTTYTSSQNLIIIEKLLSTFKFTN